MQIDDLEVRNVQRKINLVIQDQQESGPANRKVWRYLVIHWHKRFPRLISWYFYRYDAADDKTQLFKIGDSDTIQLRDAMERTATIAAWINGGMSLDEAKAKHTQTATKTAEPTKAAPCFPTQGKLTPRKNANEIIAKVLAAEGIHIDAAIIPRVLAAAEQVKTIMAAMEE